MENSPQRKNIFNSDSLIILKQFMKFERCRISEQYDIFRDKNVSEKGKLLRLEVKYKL